MKSSYKDIVRSNYSNVKLSLISTFFITFTMMLISFNKLIAVPLDKIFLCFFILFYTPLIVKLEGYGFMKGEKQTLLMLCFVTIMSLMMNIDTFSFQIFLPIVGFIFSIYLSQSAILLKGLYYGSFIHILIGDILGLSSYVIGANPFVSNLAYKGMPLLNSVMGFTPTPQSFGTLCLSWLIVYFFLKERGEIKRIDKVFYLIVTLGIFLSINRTTYIGYLLILFFKRRRLFRIYLSIGVILVVIFWNSLMDTIFNTVTLDSREELLDGFNRSFWKSDSLEIYLFGRADNKVAEKYIRYATWDKRDDIENGFAMILHMLGFLGLGYYVIAVFSFVAKILRRRYLYECALLLFFCIISPGITQEYVATTFYIGLGILIYIYKRKVADESGALDIKKTDIKL